MAQHIVRWIPVDEGGIRVDGNMGDCSRERRRIGNENYVVYGVVIEFISPTTVMCCSGPTVADWKIRADRMEDLQVSWRGRVNVCQLCRAIAVPNPHALQGSHHHTVGSWAIRGGLSAPTRPMAPPARGAAHPRT